MLSPQLCPIRHWEYNGIKATISDGYRPHNPVFHAQEQIPTNITGGIEHLGFKELHTEV